MFKISNNDFKLLNKYKDFLLFLDNVLENVPRRDMYYKDKIRNITNDLLNDIFELSYDVNKDNYDRYYTDIKAKIAMIDFMLERLFEKKYIHEKALYKLSLDLVEINKMATRWINNMRENEN